MSTTVKPEAAPKRTDTTEPRPKRRPYSDLAGIRFLVDHQGNRTDALVPIEVFQRMLDDLEDLEDIQDAYEAEQEMEGQEWVSWEDFKQELDALDTDVSRSTQ